MPEQEKSQNMSWERAEDYRLIYSNNFLFRFSVSDGSITFSQFTESPGSIVQNKVLERATVSMSLPQIKLLAEYMTVSIQELERELGPIATVGLSTEELRKQAKEIISGLGIRKK